MKANFLLPHKKIVNLGLVLINFIFLVIINLPIGFVIREKDKFAQIDSFYNPIYLNIIIAFLFLNQISNEKKWGVYDRLFISQKDKFFIHKLKLSDSIIFAFVATVISFFVCLTISLILKIKLPSGLFFAYNFLSVFYYLQILLAFYLVYNNLGVVFITFFILQILESLICKYANIKQHIYFLPFHVGSAFQSFSANLFIPLLSFISIYLIFNFLNFKSKIILSSKD